MSDATPTSSLADVQLGRTGVFGEVLHLSDEAVWVGLLGGAAGARRLPGDAGTAAVPALYTALCSRESRDMTVSDELCDVGVLVDEALRERFSPADPEGRAAMVLACVHAQTAYLVWTGACSAFLVRDGAVVEGMAGRKRVVGVVTDLDDSQPHDFVGGRPRDAAELVLHEVTPAWQLGNGDRLVIATCDLSEALSLDALAAMVASGPTEDAARAIAESLLQSAGTLVPVVVMEVGGGDPAALQAHVDRLGALLAGLEKLLPAGGPGGGADDLDDDATNPFAPVRTHSSADDDNDAVVDDDELDYSEPLENDPFDPDAVADDGLPGDASAFDEDSLTPEPRPLPGSGGRVVRDIPAFDRPGSRPETLARSGAVGAAAERGPIPEESGPGLIMIALPALLVVAALAFALL